MFVVDCHTHGARVMLDWSRIEGMRDSDEGPILDWRCWCGARGSLIAGVRSEPRAVDPVELPVDRGGELTPLAS